jgi:hypothetical protein
MPAQTETKGTGAHTPTEKYGVMSPFHAGGGGGGGGGGGAGGSGAATQLFDGASNTVPAPHSAALLSAGEATCTITSGASVAPTMIAKRRNMHLIAGLPRIFPDPCLVPILRPLATSCSRIDDRAGDLSRPRWAVELRTSGDVDERDGSAPLVEPSMIVWNDKLLRW